MKDVAIVAIGYKSEMTDGEKLSFKRCLDVFQKRDIFVVGPLNVSRDEYVKINENQSEINFINLEEKWFKSVFTYGKMLMQKWFYELFLEYKYILIYQLDCYVFNDNLDYFVSLDYDYYGATWLWDNTFYCVGNGGLSLRKISAFIENLEERKDLDFINSDKCDYFIEDHAFCTGFYPLKNICPINIAEQFSFETSIFNRNPDEMNIEDFPMGIHGFANSFKINFCGKDVMLSDYLIRAIKRWNELNSKL